MFRYQQKKLCECEMGWCKYGEGSFPEAVGNALWGSKWYEVMPGEPPDDLEDQIRTGKVKGSWPAARDDWGLYRSKLETVLLVAVPSESPAATPRRPPSTIDRRPSLCASCVRYATLRYVCSVLES